MHKLERKKILKEEFINYFKEEPTAYFSAPGRIEIIGNHVDHNGGSAIVSTINLDILGATKKGDNNFISIYSKEFKEISLSLDELASIKVESFTSLALLKGILICLKESNYHIGGFKCYLDSLLPIGIGISSSAAFECLIIQILNYYYNDNKISRREISKIAQYAESSYYKKPCGLLDQCAISYGGLNYIDFKRQDEPEVKAINNIIKGYKIILLNTGGSHDNLSSSYEEIKKDMCEIAHFLKAKTLREVDKNDFLSSINLLKEKFDTLSILRAYHFYNECENVSNAYKALKDNDMKSFLNSLNNSSYSSISYLQNMHVRGSRSQNIDLGMMLVKTLLKDGTCRIHGGGFEGTILIFVSNKEYKSFLNDLSKYYKREDIYPISLTRCGARKV